MNIKTTYEPKPVGGRQFDWSAWDDETYDGEGSPIGFGATEAEAIADLESQIEALRPDPLEGIAPNHARREPDWFEVMARTTRPWR